MKLLWIIVFVALLWIGSTLAYDPTPSYVDLYGQFTRTSQHANGMDVSIAVNTKQTYPYPYATNIVVACYEARQYDTRRTLLASATVNILHISFAQAAHVNLTIPKTTEHQTVLCHIDDTNIVPELNDRNHLGWLHIDPKEQTTPAPKPTPTPSPTPKPTPRPLPIPVPTPPVCEEKREYVCEETLHRERKDTYMSDLGLVIPAEREHIKQYRIQRNNGTRSKRYTPGQDDIDLKWEGCDPDVRYFVPPTHCQRRMRAYFGDHTYEIKTCERETKTICTPGKPVYTPPPVPTPCKRNDCDFVELPSVDYGKKLSMPTYTPPAQQCRGSYCGMPLTPISRPTPVRQDAPVYRPQYPYAYTTPHQPTYNPSPYNPPISWLSYDKQGLASCLGRDCDDASDTSYGGRRGTLESVHDEFERDEWVYQW